MSIRSTQAGDDLGGVFSDTGDLVLTLLLHSRIFILIDYDQTRECGFDW
jgi:hypothetical protein